MSHFDRLSVERDLLELDFRNMYVEWGKSSPARHGMHASAVLASESEWCTREQVLNQLYPEQGEKQEWNSWDWKKSAIFENGWNLHRRWQRLFEKFGNVVYSSVNGANIAYIPTAELNKRDDLMEINGKLYAPELDLTHYDAERGLYFSPDAIIDFGPHRYVVEIKGLKQESYQKLSDDLLESIQADQTVAKARIQANFYMHLLKLERGIILIENKSNQDFRLYVTEYDESLCNEQVQRIYEVKKYVTLCSKGKSALPARTCQSVNDPRARKCPMKSVCFQEV